jgi:hypothetical protein
VFLIEYRSTFREVHAAFIVRALIALVMEAARTSETSVNIQLRTRQYIPEDSEFRTRRRENLKSQILTEFIRISENEL